eukprot:5743358-Lingulodinium_polyedra.AAC.1
MVIANSGPEGVLQDFRERLGALSKPPPAQPPPVSILDPDTAGPALLPKYAEVSLPHPGRH